MILIRQIKHRRNSRRVQAVIAQYCDAAVRAKQSGSRPEIENVEKVTINMQRVNGSTSSPRTDAL